MYKLRAQKSTVMKATIEESPSTVAEGPTVTELDDEKIAINEEHMEDVISKGVQVFNDGPTPDPE